MIKNLIALVFCMLMLLIASVGIASSIQQGFILRGQLPTPINGVLGYHYKVGSLDMVVPADSVLLPSLKNLEGKRVLITVWEDK